MMGNILLVDDDIDTSIKYKEWLKEEGFNPTVMNDPQTAEREFKPNNYDLVLISFKLSVMDGFNLYEKLRQLEKKVEGNPIKEFRICFMTTSRINYKALAEVYPELGKECYVSKEVLKDVFVKHIHELLS